MKADEYRAQMQFEHGLKVGDECTAYWTNSGHAYKGRVEVEAINVQSYRVWLLEEVPTDLSPGGRYFMGQSLNIPSIRNLKRWSWNNRLAPVEVDHYQEYLEAGVEPGKEVTAHERIES